MCRGLRLPQSVGAFLKKLDADDKTGVGVGEPGLPVSTSVRRHKHGAIVAKKSAEQGASKDKAVVRRGDEGHKLAAADHEFTRATLTPSVTLHGEIPDKCGDSWCGGQVFINLNDATFQPSSAWRHAAEYTYQIVNEAILLYNSAGDDDDHVEPISTLRAISDLPDDVWKFVPDIIHLSTDGGPDHNFAHLQVKCSLVALQRVLRASMLTALRCAPNGSYIMTAERVMPLLNLGL